MPNPYLITIFIIIIFTDFYVKFGLNDGKYLSSNFNKFSYFFY